MIPLDQLIIDESRMPPPPHAVSTAGTLWTMLRGFSQAVLVNAQLLVGTGGKILALSSKQQKRFVRSNG